MTVTILNTDVLDGLRSLPDDSVNCVVTSPPYWGLRDYGVEGQIGSEGTLDEHIAVIVGVFREVRRVLRTDGTLWFNYGDAYAGSWGAQSRGEDPGPASKLSGGQVHAAPKNTHTGSLKRTPGLKPKDLMGLPWRLAFALQADGWWLRADVIWHKPNPMPESVTDRPTKAHEYVFLLTKAERYHYDAEAIKEFATYPDGPNAPDKIVSPYGQGMARNNIGAKGNANGFRGGSYVGGKPGPRTSTGNDKQRGHSRRHAGFNDRWDAMPKDEQRGSRNKRSVWTIATVPFPDAHFATFPPELPEICIKAGCPVGGTVLDPFGGAGTTGLVADRLQRHAILIELNPAYAAMARRRIDGDRGGLLDVMEASA
jgi:DNA modification methylase